MVYLKMLTVHIIEVLILTKSSWLISKERNYIHCYINFFNKDYIVTMNTVVIYYFFHNCIKFNEVPENQNEQFYQN